MNLANWQKMMIRGRKYIPAIPIFFALLFSFSPGVLAQGLPAIKQEDLREPVRVRADHIAYDKADDSYVAEGNVEIQQGNRKLTADFVSLKASTNEAQAKGNVVLVEGEDVLRSKEIKIDLGTNRGIILQGSLFLKKQNFTIRGEEIERQGEETYRVRKGSFTTCEGDWPAWRFTGRDTLVTLEEYATVHGAAFEIKNIPVFYSPYLIFPVKTKRQSGFLIPRIGFRLTTPFSGPSPGIWMPPFPLTWRPGKEWERGWNIGTSAKKKARVPSWAITSAKFNPFASSERINWTANRTAGKWT